MYASMLHEDGYMMADANRK